MMNMSDDLTSATVQLSTQVGEAGMHAVEKTIDLIGKMLQALQNAYEARKRVKSTDLTDIKSGEVSSTKLQKYAKKNSISLTTSENAFTKDDMNVLKSKAKKFGIPIAFVNEKGKDNVYVQIRTSDLPLFKNMCTELMKDKLAAMPQKLGNFKVNQWEIPFITHELNKHDLAAQFGVTKDGQHICMYNKSDEKAIMIARQEFVRKCDEVNKTLSFDRDENGNYTIKELHSGKEISFDESMSQSELYENIKKQFGFDDNKAQIACAKFGEDMLTGEAKGKFFSKSVINEFSKIETNVTLEGENILTKPYSCFRLTPKTDDIPRLVYQSSNGDFTVLSPEKMTHSEMAETLRNQLHIEDTETVDALIDKAEKVTDYYTNQNAENLSSQREFKKSDFDMADPDVVGNMRRVNESGDTLTKKLPIDSISNQIERNNKDDFSVTSTAKFSETDKNGSVFSSSATQTLVLSFSDKKNAAIQLADMYRKQGVPDHIAKDMAKDVIKRASAQSAEKVLQIEEIKANTTTIICNGKPVEVDTTDREKAIEDIGKAFGVSDDAAANILDKAEEQKQAALAEMNEEDSEKKNDISDPEKEEIDRSDPTDKDINSEKTDSIEKPESPKPDTPEIKTDSKPIELGSNNAAPEIPKPQGRKR